jgi:hypothetical protein
VATITHNHIDHGPYSIIWNETLSTETNPIPRMIYVGVEKDIGITHETD